MKTFNRIAVVLVGELRTWARASEYLFKFFDQASHNIDYFFVTWNVSSQTGELISITEQDILAPFQKYNKNCVSYKILEPIGKHSTTFYNQAWLSKVGNILKRKYEAENNFIYEQVIETRPDCYFRKYGSDNLTTLSFKGVGWSVCEDQVYEGDIPEINQFNCGLIGLGDVYFRLNSFTSDIFADRYYFRKTKIAKAMVDYTYSGFTNHHLTMSEFLYKRLMKPCSYRSHCDYKFYCCIRPSFPTDIDLDELDTAVLSEMFTSYEKNETFFYGPGSDLPFVDK